MSGFFGIFNRNEKPVEEKTVNTMLDAMSYWGPDERHTWVDGSVAFGHAMLWNTPESKYEHLPLEKDAYVLTMDARIDNRDELLKEIELPDRPFEEIGDSEFILAAYRKWGEDCPKHLLGDFAFVIWDEKKQQLFCARDHVGIKPFYYYLDDKKFIFANDVEPIIQVPNFSQEISDEAVINFFTFRQLKDSKITFFKNIIKLEAATTLTISFTTEKKSTYWKIEDAPKIYFDTEEEYVNQLKELLTESVECRSRSAYPIASHLSGGLDSSLISTIASRYLQKHNKQLYSYNWVHTPTKEEDKDDFDFSMSRQISENEKIKHQYIDFTAQDLLDMYLTHDIRLNDTLILWYEHFLRQKASSDGVRTILSGWGGDELISSNGLGYLTGLFWKGNIWKPCKEMYKFSKRRTKNIPYIKFLYAFMRRCMNYLILPKLPFQSYCKYVGMDCDQFDYGQTLTKEYKHIKDKLNLEGEKEITPIGQNANQLDLFHHGHLLTRIESWASGGIRNKITYSYPLLDKRIIEFALGIPEDYFFKDGENRYIFKKAISDIVPKKLCWKEDTKFEPNRLKRLQRVSQMMIEKWENSDYKIQVEQNKYIDSEEFIKIMSQLKQNKNYGLDDYSDIIKATILILGMDNE